MSTTKEKVAIYARVSLSDGARERLDSQVDSLVKYCFEKGYDTDESLIYTDLAVASGGGIEGRPGFSNLIEDAEAGRFKTVFAWDWDRLARSPISSAHLQHIVQKYDLKLVLASSGIVYSKHDTLAMSVQSAMATEYLRIRKSGCNCNEQR